MGAVNTKPTLGDRIRNWWLPKRQILARHTICRLFGHHEHPTDWGFGPNGLDYFCDRCNGITRTVPPEPLMRAQIRHWGGGELLEKYDRGE